MRNIIVGTAGHIDHGKTALVGELTGVNTDRLAEERRRGISIELGFAQLELTNELRIGFVDVPGHERFVKNMLAGAGGIDLVVLVIAADESIKPQTREHFDICRLLGLRRGLVAITKADLVDDELIDLVRLEIGEFVEGSFLEGAPIVPVSVKTGRGLDEFRRHLRDVALEATPKDSSRHFRLSIDRAFAMKGFGRVVTGTLLSGAVNLEDEVAVHPAGETVRVRGIQVHGAASKRATAGQRTALNLAGAAAASATRGATLTHPGLFRPTKTVECRFELLGSAKPLKHRAPVHFHAGTAEVIAETRLLESAEPLKPGTAGFVRFLLREPVLLLPGDPFIVRMFSPVVTIGGGRVLEIAPPPRLRRSAAVERLRVLDGSSGLDRVLLLVQEAEFGLGIGELVARTGLLEEEIDRASTDRRFLYLREPERWIISRERNDVHIKALRAALKDYHRQNPLQPGVSKEELRSRELAGAPAFYLDALLARAGDLVPEGQTVRLASHKLRLQADEDAAIRKIEAAFEEAGLAVPATAAVLERSGVDARRARNLLQVLLRDGRLVKVGDELIYHLSAVERLRGLLARHRGEHFKVPQFKEWTGISRKYAIPLLEYLDRQRVTRRDGDERIVL